MWDVQNPLIDNGIFTISTGAGFQPSTVLHHILDFFLADVQERADARGVTPLLAAAGFCGSSLLVKLLLDAKA